MYAESMGKSVLNGSILKILIDETGLVAQLRKF
jgi:hypothetical protein